MIREVVWSARATRDLRRLDQTTARRVLAAVHRYAETEQGDVKRLTDVEPPTWRLRAGDYRVRFRFEAAESLTDGGAGRDVTERLLIQRVLHRREAYRD